MMIIYDISENMRDFNFIYNIVSQLEL